MKYWAPIPLAAFLSALAPHHASACPPTNNPCGIFHFRDYLTGGAPQGGVILGPDGTLYGETLYGGTKPCHATYGEVGYGCGTVYSISKAGGYKVLVSFHGPNGAFGASTPTLVGNTLYGTTERGGTGKNGVIFAVNTDGSNFTLLHQFNGTDGSNPVGPLLPGPNGILYGITNDGGSGFPNQNPGVLFSLTPTGTYTILYEFSEADGANPTTMIMTPSGVLVGGTYFGGPGNNICGAQGCGVVFSFDPANVQYTVLKTYDGTAGTSPYIGSVATNDTVYGNDDNLFSITLAGDYTLLAQSNPYLTGETPASGPLLAANGMLYGTYSSGIGTIPGGTLYSYNPSNPGILNALCYFGTSTSGSSPDSQPTLAPNGDLIGTTLYAGSKHLEVSGAIYDCTPESPDPTPPKPAP